MKKILIFVLKITIAVLIITYLVRSNYDAISEGLKNFNIIWLLPALLILYTEMTISSVRWHALLKIINVNLSLRECISLTMRGYFCSLILFGGAIGGDVAKIGMIAHGREKGQRFEPGLSILIDRIIGMIALFLSAIVLMLFDYKTLLKVDLTQVGIAPENNIYVLAGAFMLCAAGIIAAAIIFSHRLLEKAAFFKFIFDKADHLTKGLVSRMKNAIDLYLSSWKTLLLWTVASIFLVHLIQMPILWAICCGLNISIPSYLTLASAITLGNIAGLIPLTPGGIGLRDFTILAILSAGTFDGASTVPLLMSLVLIIGNLSAGIFFFDKGLQRKTIPENNSLTNGEAL